MDWMTLVVPFLIFLARICDVSIGTVRLIFTTRGLRGLAPVLGFFEVLIWLVAIRQIMLNLTNPVTYVAYALGFAAGTYVGMLIEERVSIGKVLLRVVTNRDATALVGALRDAHFTVTTTAGQGNDGKVRLVLTVVKRHDLARALAIVKGRNPNAFYTVEDVRLASDDGPAPSPIAAMWRLARKGK